MGKKKRQAFLNECFETGRRSGDIGGFCLAFEKAQKVGKLTAQSVDLEALDKLIEGAQQGFLEGKPGNVQTALARREDFYGVHYQNNRVPLDCVKILSALAAGSDDAEAAVRLATQEMKDAERQAFLDGILFSVLKRGSSDAAFVAGLIGAGADVNMEVGGKKGVLLAKAITENSSEDVIRVLHRSGADFDAAAFLVRTDRDWDYSDRRTNALEKLGAYLGKFSSAAPSVPALAEGDAETKQILKALVEQVADLTEEVHALREGRPAAPATGEKPGPDRYGHLKME
jgi:hypothetical protein